MHPAARTVVTETRRPDVTCRGGRPQFGYRGERLGPPGFCKGIGGGRQGAGREFMWLRSGVSVGALEAISVGEPGSSCQLVTGAPQQPGATPTPSGGGAGFQAAERLDPGAGEPDPRTDGSSRRTGPLTRRGGSPDRRVPVGARVHCGERTGPGHAGGPTCRWMPSKSTFSRPSIRRKAHLGGKVRWVREVRTRQAGCRWYCLAHRSPQATVPDEALNATSSVAGW